MEEITNSFLELDRTLCPLLFVSDKIKFKGTIKHPNDFFMFRGNTNEKWINTAYILEPTIKNTNNVTNTQYLLRDGDYNIYVVYNDANLPVGIILDSQELDSNLEKNIPLLKNFFHDTAVLDVNKIIYNSKDVDQTTPYNVVMSSIRLDDNTTANYFGNQNPYTFLKDKDYAGFTTDNEFATVSYLLNNRKRLVYGYEFISETYYYNLPYYIDRLYIYITSEDLYNYYLKTEEADQLMREEGEKADVK